MKTKSSAVLATITAAALFGTSATSRSLSQVDVSSTAIAAGRLLVGSIGLLLIVLLAGGARNLFKLLQRNWIWGMGLAVAGYQALFFIGTDLTGVAIGTVASLALGPLFAGLLGWRLSGVAPARNWWFSTAIAIAGVLALSFEALDGTSAVNLFGVIAAIGAGGAYAIYTVLGGRGIQANQDSTQVLAAAFLIGAGLLSPMLFTQGGELLEPKAIWLILWLGLGSTTLAYVLFGYGLRFLSASSVATLNLAEPVVATLLGLFILRESLSVMSAIGVCFITVALSLLAVSSMKESSE